MKDKTIPRNMRFNNKLEIRPIYFKAKYHAKVSNTQKYKRKLQLD